MKYKILQENTFGKSLKQIVSENREFTNDDINFFINPTNEYVEMPLAIKNMDSAMKLFIEEIDKIKFTPPLYLLNGKNKLELKFDCTNCEMLIIS